MQWSLHKTRVVSKPSQALLEEGGYCETSRDNRVSLPPKILLSKLGEVVYTYVPAAQEAEAGGLPEPRRSKPDFGFEKLRNPA